MITIADLTKLLSMINNIIKQQTAGLTQADTLLQPQPSGNCMNWVLGHALINQIILLQLLEVESPIDEAELAAYTTDSMPIAGEGSGVLPLERLLEYHDLVHQLMLTRLGEMSDADFERQVESNDRTFSLGWRVFFRQFHLTYHVGQLELLRQMAGKTEKII
jgi:hypothetical protein